MNRKIYIFLATLLFPIIVFAQENNKREIEYPGNGFTDTTEAKNQTVNGLKEGKWLEYTHQEEHPPTDLYEDDEVVLTVYKAGKPYGVVRIYGEGSGILLGEIPYKEGKINGIAKDYYRSGKLWHEMPFTNGTANGVEKWYYENGKLQKEMPRTNDRANGVVKDYYDSGKLKSETPYVNGIENGVQKNYDKNGKIESIMTFVNGEETDWKRCDKNGKEIK